MALLTSSVKYHFSQVLLCPFELRKTDEKGLVSAVPDQGTAPFWNKEQCAIVSLSFDWKGRSSY